MGSRLAERLRAARLRRFVGRDAEQALFTSALHAADPPFFVLHIYGPGGIGKTTLLRALSASCADAGAQALRLDGRHLDPNPVGFIAALRGALDLPGAADPLAVLQNAGRRHVLFVDTFEMLAPLDPWLRETFLPDVPTEVLVVTAGRNPMAPPWHADPGWQELLREVPLRAFSDDECRTYLARRGVDPGQHGSILRFTHGHPLALSLVADLFEQRPEQTFAPDAAPDVIKALVDQFLQQVPGPAHRAALEASALVRVVNESLLARMLGQDDVHEVFAWMRRVSFIEAGPYGLFPHELAREALTADLRWRNPEWYAELHDRARAYYADRLEQTHGRDQQRVLFDYIYLHRDNPVIKPFLDWQETGSALPEAPADPDHPALCAMVERHEGAEAARIAAHWLHRQPEGALLFRDLDGIPAGYLHLVALQKIADEDRAADPAVATACAYLERHAPLRAGERGTLIRFWMAADSYQAVSSMQSLLFLKIAQHYLTTPDLAFSFFPCADADFWAPFCAYTDLQRLEEAAFEVEGRRYGVFGHDWRAVPPMRWLDLLAARELGLDEAEPPEAAEPLAVLDHHAFSEAVRGALKAYARPFELGENPLLRCRLVANAAGDEADAADRIEALRSLLDETAGLLRASPRDALYYRVLDRTYFRPARSQEQAAELLDLPISTFRRYLKRGVEQLTEHLWQQETRV
ncbi:MAG: hypothetical protein R3247_11080 [Rhodothermales bacterium]|nr:hypothetical protein [Rhodothermales bacterium]